MTEKLYVMGHPVAHSKSPIMHNAAYQALGLHWEYGLMDCPSEVSARVFLNARNWRACNVTMPWKPLAYDAATTTSEAADLAQGANVLVNWAGRLHADNTDGKGCVAYLKRRGVRFEDANIAVCGTGPTSLAIAHACAMAGSAQICLLSRDCARAQQAIDEYQLRLAQAREWRGGSWAQQEAHEEKAAEDPEEQSTDGAQFVAHAYDSEGLAALAESSVIIDATPLGMNPDDPAPFDTSVLSANQVVFDVVYGHGETALLAAAREIGCAAYDGAGMLVAQAVETVRDIADVTGYFTIPSHMDLFSIMADAAGFDL